MALDINKNEKFPDRHNGPDQGQINEMLEKVNAVTIEELIDQTIPQSIRLTKELNLPEPKSEFQFLKDFKNLAIHNKIFKTHIGMGYYNCIVPSVILFLQIRTEAFMQDRRHAAIMFTDIVGYTALMVRMKTVFSQSCSFAQRKTKRMQGNWLILFGIPSVILFN